MIGEFLLILGLSCGIFAAVIVVLAWVRTPRYRLQRDNIVQLLTLVLEERASADDWNVFVTLSIHYDDELEAIRQRCIAIEADDYLGGTGHPRPLFTRRGLEKLAALRQELQRVELS